MEWYRLAVCEQVQLWKVTGRALSCLTKGSTLILSCCLLFLEVEVVLLMDQTQLG